jgi:hypothetical protein
MEGNDQPWYIGPVARIRCVLSVCELAWGESDLNCSLRAATFIRLSASPVNFSAPDTAN